MGCLACQKYCCCFFILFFCPQLACWPASFFLLSQSVFLSYSPQFCEQTKWFHACGWKWTENNLNWNWTVVAQRRLASEMLIVCWHNIKLKWDDSRVQSAQCGYILHQASPLSLMYIMDTIILMETQTCLSNIQIYEIAKKKKKIIKATSWK